jgi:hypothetical protein
VKKDSDMYLALDTLAQDVGILGIFSDWPATVSYYASCLGIRVGRSHDLREVRLPAKPHLAVDP